MISSANCCYYIFSGTVGRKEGRASGRADGRTEGRTDGRSETRTGGRSDGQMDGRADGRSHLFAALWRDGCICTGEEPMGNTLSLHLGATVHLSMAALSLIRNVCHLHIHST